MAVFNGYAKLQVELQGTLQFSCLSPWVSCYPVLLFKIHAKLALLSLLLMQERKKPSVHFLLWQTIALLTSGKLIFNCSPSELGQVVTHKGWTKCYFLRQKLLVSSNNSVLARLNSFDFGSKSHRHPFLVLSFENLQHLQWHCK